VGLNRRLVAVFVLANAVEEVAMPQLKHQQPPDDAGLITPSAKVFVENLPDGIRIEVSPLQGSRL
jgi:hypothetical protein